MQGYTNMTNERNFIKHTIVRDVQCICILKRMQQEKHCSITIQTVNFTLFRLFKIVAFS